MGKTLILLVAVVTLFILNISQASTENVVILDVRTSAEFNESHVKGALNIDIRENDFKDKIAKMDKSKTYKVYCRSGNRSSQAIKIMKDLDFKNIENIGGLEKAAKTLNTTCVGNPC